ncbi:MAG TPA: FecR family protein [bacterium]|jgi:hypothetical protein|nr:FecR family protein [bacterium]
MVFRKTALFLLPFYALFAWPSLSLGDPPALKAVFESVKGKVTILGPAGIKKKNPHKESAVREGDRVSTGKESSATLVMFDGSRLEIGAETSMTISKLQKPSELDKVLQFKLLVGHLLAQVKKLATSKSSFEVEAGGVVCGVRGTEFAMEYVPKTNSLFVNVVEGSVFTQFVGQKEITLTAGQKVHFSHVPPSIPNGQGSGNPAPNSKGTTPGGNGTGSGGQNGNSSSSGSNGEGSGGQGSSGTSNGSPSGTDNNPNPNGGSPNGGSAGLSGNGCLGDLNNQFLNQTLVNCDNNLVSAQQTLRIRLVVP